MMDREDEKRLTPEQKGELALRTLEMTPDQRMRLADSASMGWPAAIASRYRDVLPMDWRLKVAREATPWARGCLVYHATDFPKEQRLELMQTASSFWKVRFAIYEEWLAPDQREELLLSCDSRERRWAIEVASLPVAASWLTPERKGRLLEGSGPENDLVVDEAPGYLLRAEKLK